MGDRVCEDEFYPPGEGEGGGEKTRGEGEGGGERGIVFVVEGWEVGGAENGVDGVGEGG